MSEHPTSEQRFNKIAGKRLSADISVRFSKLPGLPARRYLRLSSKIPQGYTLLSVKEAKALRDWLKKACPR